jgi:hypothetical protein
MIAEVMDGLAAADGMANEQVEREVGARVLALCARFPIYK